jgi:hypothetical protein
LAVCLFLRPLSGFEASYCHALIDMVGQIKQEIHAIDPA